MKFSLNNFLYAIKQIVTGDKAEDGGFLKKDEGISLATLRPVLNLSAIKDNTGGVVSTTIANTAGSAPTTAEFENAIASIVAQLNTIVNHLSGTASETNARVLQVENGVDTIGNIRYVVPRDYDEAVDSLKLRVLASVLGVATDGDVQLDAEVYVKKAGVALSADKNPDKPATVLAVAEQWVEFDLSGYGLKRDDIVYIKLITDGHNDTVGEEVQVHDLELVYRSTLVSYNENDSSGNGLR